VRVASAAVYRRPNVEILTPPPHLTRPPSASRVLLGASCVWANC